MTSPDFMPVNVVDLAHQRGRARVEREVAEAAAKGLSINPAPPGEMVEDWGIPPDTPDRIHHRSLEDALSSWGKLTDASALAIVHQAVDQLRSQLGPISEVYELTSRQYVAVKFGGDVRMHLMIEVGVLYLTEAPVIRLGGYEAALAALPGFVRDTRQAGNAGLRRELPTHLASGNRERQREVATAPHCGVRQPIGSECMYCGAEVQA
jgi:hypothetical protein